MAGILMTIFLAEIDGLAFFRTNHAFIKTDRGDTEAERRQHDLTGEKLQKSKR